MVRDETGAVEAMRDEREWRDKGRLKEVELLSC